MKDEHTGRPGSPTRRSGISPITVRRLSLYLRYLEELAEKGQSTVASRQLGQALGLTAAQVRKDLAYFGQFGRPGVGYHVGKLANHLRSIFGTDRISNVAVVGVGDLGRALLRYRGWLKKGFRVVGAFDTAPSTIGKKFGKVAVQSMDQLPAAVKTHQIRLAILAVPAGVAQEVAGQICRAGVQGILNFAPVTLNVPAAVAVVPVDLAVQLEQLSYLTNTRAPRRRPGNRAKRRPQP